MTAPSKVTAPIPPAPRRVIVLEETPAHEAAELLDALERAPPMPESIALNHLVSEERGAPGCRAAAICYDEKMDGAIAPSPDSVELKRWRFKSADVQRMIEIGILPQKTRFELIHGDLVEKMPEGDAHWDARQRLVDWFYRRLPPEVALAPDGPLRLAEEEEPEPDLFLFPRSMRVNAVRGPDALLVVEVADSSLAKDRSIKGPIYAAHGVREYWIVDLGSRTTLVHRDPSPKGYLVPDEVAFDAELRPLLLPEIVLRVIDAL